MLKRKSRLFANCPSVARMWKVLYIRLKKTIPVTIFHVLCDSYLRQSFDFIMFNAIVLLQSRHNRQFA